MGSSTSKAVRNTTNSTPRRYPARVPSISSHQTNGQKIDRNQEAPLQQAPQSQVQYVAGSSTVEEPAPDLSDPALRSRLRSIGPVRPSPHYSPTSRSPIDPQPNAAAGLSPPQFPPSEAHPALAILSARQKFQEAANEEFNSIGRKAFRGRTLLDAGTIRQALALRDEQRKTTSDIERILGLQNGVLRMLGPKGVISAAAIHGDGFGEDKT